MNLEVLLKKAGDAGPFQLMLFILIGVVNLYTGMEMMVVNFLAPKHPHWCHVPELAHLPSSVQLSAAIPWDYHTEDYSTCLQYDLPAENWSSVADMYHRDDLHVKTVSDRDAQEDIPTRKCDQGWNFDRSQFHNTIISEWLLVCGSEGILELISPIFTLGLFIGSLVGGMVSDKLGRMTSLLTFTVLHLLAGVATSFSPNIYFFIGARFVIAVCIRGAGISGAVLLMESLTSRFRVAAVVGYQMFLGLGIVSISALAMVLRDFRDLQLTIVVPLVCMIAYKWLLAESPVWFVSKGNTDSAIKVVQKISKMNEGLVPLRDYQEFQRQNDSESPEVKARDAGNADPSAVEASLSFIDLLRHAVLRRYTLVSYFTMITCLFIDLGVALNLNSLFGDVYTNGFLTGASEMAANLLFYFAIQFLGRRASLLICFFGIIGTESLSVTMQLIDMKFVSSIMSILSRCLASSGYLTLNIYVAELFPTAVRQGALGSANAIAALVGIAAPLVGGSLHLIWFPLPNIIFGSLALLCIPLCFLLPETKGQGMPHTLIDSVNLLTAPKPPKNEEKDDEKDDDKLDDDVRNCMKDRRPNRHTHDLECGVFDDDGNLLYKENASLGDFSFTNVVRLDSEMPRPSYIYRVPIVPTARMSQPLGTNDNFITYL